MGDMNETVATTKIPVLGTGMSGLVGSCLIKELGDTYEFTNLDLTNGVNILDEASIEALVSTSPAKSLIHLAAFTDANAAQEQNGDKSGMAYQINVVGTENIARICAKYGVHLIHISTSYVFDGTKTDPYVETDTMAPLDWYGWTKAWAEEKVQEIAPNSVILRISFPYRQDDFPKKDIWHKMADALQQGKNGPFFSDHLFTLTPLEWFAGVIDWALSEKPSGIFHATSDHVYTDLSLATEIRDSLGLTQELLGSSVHTYNANSARPYAPNLVLSNAKLRQSMSQT
jgi:dTDP-4-dehydrorhamnose reductase